MLLLSYDLLPRHKLQQLIYLLDVCNMTYHTEKITKNVIREKMNVKNFVLDYIKYKQLNSYDHVQRMDEERLLRKILEWCPSGRRKGRPRNWWMQELTTGMREMGINNVEWVDREG